MNEQARLLLETYLKDPSKPEVKLYSAELGGLFEGFILSANLIDWYDPDTDPDEHLLHIEEEMERMVNYVPSAQVTEHLEGDARLIIATTTDGKLHVFYGVFIDDIFYDPLVFLGEIDPAT